MSKFEKGQGYSREAYDKNSEDEVGLKAQIAGAKTADEMMAIAMKLKEIEGNKSELNNKAYDEAVVEDTNKLLDKTFENLKAQIADAKTADEVMELANKMKEIEGKKSNLAKNSKEKLEIASQNDKSESLEKAERVLSELKISSHEKEEDFLEYVERNKRVLLSMNSIEDSLGKGNESKKALEEIQNLKRGAIPEAFDKESGAWGFVFLDDAGNLCKVSYPSGLAIKTIDERKEELKKAGFRIISRSGRDKDLFEFMLLTVDELNKNKKY